MTPIACSHFGKKNARALSKSEVDELEYLKLCIFTGIDPMIEVTPEIVQKIINNNTKPSKAFLELAESKIDQFFQTWNKKPNASEVKHIYASTLAEMFCFE